MLEEKKITKVYLKGKEGSNIFVSSYQSKSESKAVIHILHGMAEYGDRYEDFANFLTNNNYAVYVHDHRKHGKSITLNQKVGIFDEKDTWDNILEDVEIVNKYIRSKEENKKIIIFGHSMGSFITRSYIQKYNNSVDGAVLSGTGYANPLTCRSAIVLGEIIKIIKKNSRSKFLDDLTLGSLNKTIENPRTNCDWLSRDEREVDKYIKDELCGYRYSSKFYIEFYKGIASSIKDKNICKTKHMPILFISGEKDPVGQLTSGVKKVFNKYISNGYKDDLSLKFIEGARHEIINEINNQEVYETLLNWINTIDI
ncbi:alpha/beta fold hydrolase [Helicovermis profundi]|uniref:Alpha/beta hydrolase n=1 Tax=Helicovermis profundi TaxID=3065157 RepID=A0AAU9EQT7_9FIRM|nr:alpha/beta hydrolase [Clostridia bacterium S502]